MADDGLNELANLLESPQGSAACSSKDFPAIRNFAMTGPPKDDSLDIDKVRNDLSEQLIVMKTTDALIEKLLVKAQDCRSCPRLERAVGEMLESQDKALEVQHKALKLYKFKKTHDGLPAKAVDYQSAAADLRRQIENMTADTKAIRAFLPNATK